MTIVNSDLNIAFLEAGVSEALASAAGVEAAPREKGASLAGILTNGPLLAAVVSLITAALLAGAIFYHGAAQRYELYRPASPDSDSAFRLDRLTGKVSFCGPGSPGAICVGPFKERQLP